ncbi:NAD(P)-dependent oxidoreductase [Altericista sp. CCNU0014]|uniref:NAD(P)-dependent oxidoreductase n=1 Tax=Altericista sp. CCNU0014 TaxID=3082949 RepID=UPI00384F6D78
MNLLIFGATGGTGRALVEQALAQGNAVTAFVRDPAKLDIQHPSLKVVEGDVTDAAAVECAVQGQDTAFSTLGSKSLKNNPTLIEGVRNIVRAMESQGVRRLVYQSSLGVGDSRERVGFLVRSIIIPLVLRNAIADHEEKERIIKQSTLEWVIVRPAGLTDGPRTSHYRHGESIEFGAKISRADVADFMLKQASETGYARKTPGISY